VGVVLVKTVRAVFCFLIFAAFLSLFCSCGNGNEMSGDGEPKLRVFASFYAVFDLTSKIAGDRAEVFNIVSSGTEPHNWEPSAGDMNRLQNADIVFYNGLGMESWIDSVRSSLGNEKPDFVCVSERVEALRDDPHVWLNPNNALIEADNIKKALSEADPKNAQYYQSNFESFKQNILKLDSDFENAVSNSQNKTIVVAHQAYGYLCQRYGLEQLAVEGLSADSEPSPAKMNEILEFIKNNNVKYIFFEELLPDKAVSVISQETGAQMLSLNPFEGAVDEGDDYFSVMYDNLDNIKQALN